MRRRMREERTHVNVQGLAVGMLGTNGRPIVKILGRGITVGHVPYVVYETEGELRYTAVEGERVIE